MNYMRIAIPLLRTLALVITLLFSFNGGIAAQDVKIGDAAARTLAQASLTAPDGVPFHLKLRISEPGQPDSDYTADIEEYWISPTKWRRTITSPDFKQTLIVNGESLFEQNSDDYYPFWIRDVVLAIFDPSAMLGDDARFENAGALVEAPIRGLPCTWFTASTANSGARLAGAYCYASRIWQLTSISTSTYGAYFNRPIRFRDKVVAQVISLHLKPGLELEASITELIELKNIDNSLFLVAQPTPPAKQSRTVVRSVNELQRLSPAGNGIEWPTVRGGKTSGKIGMHLSIDRAGNVREAWPLGGDNSDLQGMFADQLLTWKFKPTVIDGIAVQVEASAAFAFETKIADAYPILDDAQSRRQAEHIVEAVFRPGVAPTGTKVTVRAFVNEEGKVTGLGNINNLPSDLSGPAMQALRQWHFRPYIHDGRPDFFNANVTFEVH